MTAGRPPAEGPPNGGNAQAEGAPRRQFVKFSFFKLDPAWRRLAAEERERGKEELCRIVERQAPESVREAGGDEAITGDREVREIEHRGAAEECSPASVRGGSGCGYEHQ